MVDGRTIGGHGKDMMMNSIAHHVEMEEQATQLIYYMYILVLVLVTC